MSTLSDSELARLRRFLSAHEQRFALALVRIPQIPLRDEFSAQIEQWCQEYDRPFLRFKLAGLKPDQVWERIISGMPGGAITLIDDLDAAFHEPTGELASLLNRQRERIAELLPGPVLLVLGEGAMNRFFVDAPDLADWHAANFEFHGAPPKTAPRAEDSPVPERSAEWIESRIALLQDQLNRPSLRDRSKAGILRELAGLYSDSVYAVSANPDRPRPRDAFEAFQLGDGALREAVGILRRRAEQEPGADTEIDLARALNDWAKLLRSAGRLKDAEPLFAEGLWICERVLGQEDPLTLTVTNELALLYREQGRYTEAEPLYLRALAVSERTLGPDHLNTIAYLNNLAGLQHYQARYDKAEPLFLRALAASERALGVEHPAALTSVSNLAELYRAQGRYDKAEPLCLRALAARERVLGTEHPNTLTTLNNLAGLYLGEARYDKAEPLYLRALAARERVLGTEHPSTLTTLTNLALLYRRQARYNEAESLFTRVLAAIERVLGAEHPNTLNTANNLGFLYESEAHYAEAEHLYQRAASAADKVLGHNHPDTRVYRANLERLRSSTLTAESSPSSLRTTPDLF